MQCFQGKLFVLVLGSLDKTAWNVIRKCSSVRNKTSTARAFFLASFCVHVNIPTVFRICVVGSVYSSKRELMRMVRVGWKATGCVNIKDGTGTFSMKTCMRGTTTSVVPKVMSNNCL